MYRENARPPTPEDPYGPNSPGMRRLRRNFIVWLITAPLVTLMVICRCWGTIEAIIRLVRHQY